MCCQMVCVEMLVFGKIWKTRSTLDSKVLGKIIHKVEPSMGVLRLARLISYIHHTSNYKQHCHVGNQAIDCKLGFFQDASFAGHLTDSKSVSGGVLCIFGSPTFVPASWACKQQTAVSHSSTEAELVSHDAGLGSERVGHGVHSCIEFFRHNH